MNIKLSISFILTLLHTFAGDIKAEKGFRSNYDRGLLVEDIEELPVANNNDQELAVPDDRQLQDCGYRRRMKGGKNKYKYRNYYGFVSHLNLWNANNDKMGVQAWYKASDGRNWPRDICNKRNNIQAVIGCDLYVNSVKFRAVHTTSGKIVYNVWSPEPYVMFGIQGKNVLPSSFPELGTYNLTVTPYSGSNADGNAGQKISLLVTVKECD